MALDKAKVKNYMLCMAIFIVGMLSVSVSNVFGGYYCSVAVVESVLLTTLIYDTFDKKSYSRETFVNLIIAACITVIEIVFFIINDVFDVSVYAKNKLNFLGVCVIISQLLSIGAIVYSSIFFVLDLNKSQSHVELVADEININQDSIDNSFNEEIHKEQQEEINKDEVEEKVEIKSIKENNVEIKTPFMEEEK